MFWVGIFAGFIIAWIFFALFNGPTITRAQEIIRRQKATEMDLKERGLKP